VLLDEVGELPLSLQVKLLRVLQEKSVRPVGATQEVPVDVRVLAATNRDVEADVSSGKFRQDLYYRLNVIRLTLPPLRERVEDVPLLADRFIQRFAAEMGKEVIGFTPDGLRALTAYAFPGNVRELENVIERAVALSGSRVIGLGDLPASVSGHASSAAPTLLRGARRSGTALVAGGAGAHRRRAQARRGAARHHLPIPALPATKAGLGR
jgi:two-component system, NtrC family, response regulator PilR